MRSPLCMCCSGTFGEVAVVGDWAGEGEVFAGGGGRGVERVAGWVDVGVFNWLIQE